MKTRVVAATFILAIVSTRAAKDAEIASTLAKPGKLLFEDHFDAPGLGPRWHIRQGNWGVKDGALAGAKSATSVHPGKLDLKLPIHNAVLKFSFKVEVAGGLDLFFYQGDTRVSAAWIRNGGLSFATYPRIGPSQPAILGTTPCNFAPGVWHTVLVERKADTARVTADNGAKLEVKAPELDAETSSCLFNLRMPGEAVYLLDDVKVWEAE